MNTYLLLLLTTYTKNTPFYIPGKNIRIIFYRNIYTAASLYAVSRVSCKKMDIFFESLIMHEVGLHHILPIPHQ